MSAWDELVRRALLGTDRDPAPIVWTEPGQVANYVAQMDANDREGSLVAAAALAVVHRRAGAVPPAANATGYSIAAPEDSRPIGDRSTADLAELLFGDSGRELLAEWLDAAIEGRRCVAPVLLPALLEKGRRHPRFADRIRAVIGERGRWLADQNPEWAYAVELADASMVDFDARWETLVAHERIMFIARLRDVNPSAARERVEETWAREHARDRAALVEALHVGVTMEDEPFLEACLDDRGKEVRRSAARVLAHLSESRLSKRMVARALSYVRMESGVFVIELPDDIDEAAQRDGITRNVTESGGGRRSYWLQQILGKVPPAALSRALGRSASDLLMASRESDWARTLRAGFVAGAVISKDQDWLEALILHRVDGEDALWNLLSPKRREGLFGRQLGNAKTRTEIHRVLLHLPKMTGPWAEDFSKQIVGALAVLVRSEERLGEFPAFSVLRDAGKKLSPRVLRTMQLEHDRVPDTSYWKRPFNDALETLTHRERILRALSED